MAYDFVIGMDVSKSPVCVLDPKGRQVLSKRINRHERSLRKLFSTFLADDASVLVIVDQPNNIGRLTVAVAQDMGVDVRYLPGLAMRQLARIHVGNSKTDARDAYVIAHAGLNLTDALRNGDRVEEVFIQLKVLNGIDEDLARAYTRLINQMRSALVGTYPAFEHVLRGQMIHRKWILHLLAKYGGPTKIRRVGKSTPGSLCAQSQGAQPRVCHRRQACCHPRTDRVHCRHRIRLGLPAKSWTRC